MSSSSLSENAWPEIRKAYETKRYEICLTGPDVKKRMQENGDELDKNLFKLTNLNFIEISRTSLKSIPMEMGLMTNLLHFACHSNELELIPDNTLGCCVNLKMLDLSSNKLKRLPQDFKNLKELMTLNVSVNQLDELFPLNDLIKLAKLDINHNKFQRLPGDVCSPTLENLSQIDASSNELIELPDRFVNLPSLKLLNLESNRLEQVPANLSQCIKLKDLLLKENKLKDNRLKKLVDQNKAKAILEYLERVRIEEEKSNKKNNKTKSVEPASPASVESEQPQQPQAPPPVQPQAPMSLIESQKKKKSGISESFEVDYHQIDILHAVNNSDPKLNSLHITVMANANSIRPYVIGAIFKNLNVENDNNLKKFFKIQTKIQDETCKKRSLGTIATHDINLIKGNLVYDAKEPDSIEFIPLGHKNPMTALDFYNKLVDESEAERKQKKRNLASGLYKYLGLCEGQSKFTYIKDSANTIISLPPLSNSEKTKMNSSSKDVLVEVTSNVSLDFCKQVMQELIVETLKAGIGSLSSNSDLSDQLAKAVDLNNPAASVSGKKIVNKLTIQQVKVLESAEGGSSSGGGGGGKLKWVYPSRLDLSFDGQDLAKSNPRYHVVRLYDNNEEKSDEE